MLYLYICLAQKLASNHEIILWMFDPRGKKKVKQKQQKNPQEYKKDLMFMLII